MNFEKNIHCTVFLIYPKKCKFDGQIFIKCDFLEGRLPKYFFQEICSSGGKQPIHKVSATFIVKNCHPRTSLIHDETLSRNVCARNCWPFRNVIANKNFEENHFLHTDFS